MNFLLAERLLHRDRKPHPNDPALRIVAAHNGQPFDYPTGHDLMLAEKLLRPELNMRGARTYLMVMPDLGGAS